MTLQPAEGMVSRCDAHIVSLVVDALVQLCQFVGPPRLADAAARALDESHAAIVALTVAPDDFHAAMARRN